MAAQAIVVGGGLAGGSGKKNLEFLATTGGKPPQLRLSCLQPSTLHTLDIPTPSSQVCSEWLEGQSTGSRQIPTSLRFRADSWGVGREVLGFLSRSSTGSQKPLKPMFSPAAIQLGEAFLRPIP